MGSGRGGGGKKKLGNAQAYGQKIGLRVSNQRERFAEDPDSQQRRAGQRFHYRRKARRRTPFTTDWKELSPFYILRACILLFLVIFQVLSLVDTLANAFAAGLLSRTVLIKAFCYVFISRYVPSDGAPHHGILAATPAT